MRIGKFRHKLTFQYYTTTSDGAGGFTQTWEDDITCFGLVTPLSEAEVFEAGQQSDNNEFNIVVRFTDDFAQPFNKQYRIKYDNRIFNITRIRNLKFDRKFYEIRAMEK